MHRSNPPFGISLMVIAMIFNATKDGIAKLLAVNYTPLTLLIIQFAVTSIILAPIVIRNDGIGAIIPKNIFSQIVRSIFVTLGVGLYYWAINFINIAEATAMVLVAPLIVTALSPLILHEPLGLKRAFAVVLGFIGVIIILRPTIEADRTGYFIALGSGISLAAFYMANRKLADTTHILASSFYTSFIGLIMLLPLVSLYWTPPKLTDIYFLSSFTAFATFGQVLMIGAFSFAAASVIAPFVYSQVIWATLVGYILFGALPDPMTWLGIIVVVSAGIYVAVREITEKRSM